MLEWIVDVMRKHSQQKSQNQKYIFPKSETKRLAFLAQLKKRYYSIKFTNSCYSFHFSLASYGLDFYRYSAIISGSAT